MSAPRDTGGAPAGMGRGRRWARRTLVALAFLALLLAAALAALQTAPVRARLAAELSRVASTPGAVLTVEGVDGFLPFDIRVARVRMADEGGTWLDVADVRVRLDPWALVERRLRVPVLGAARVTVVRAPRSDAASAPSDTPMAIPHLPRGIAVDALSLDRLELGDDLLGAPAVLAVDARAAIPRGAGDAVARLDVRRIDGLEGRATLDLAWDQDAGRLDLTLTGGEPAGGLIARALGLPGLPPVTVDLRGGGPLAAWRGTLDVRAGEGLAIAGTISSDGALDRPRVQVDLRAEGRDLASLVPAPFGAGPITVSLAATLAPEATAVEDARVAWVGGEATARGTVGADGALAVDVMLDVPALAPYRSLVGADLDGTLALRAAVAGTLGAPRIEAIATARGLALGGAAIPALGPTPELTALVQGEADGALVVERLSLAGMGARVDGTVRLAGGRLAARLGVDLSPDALAGVATGGMVRLDADLEGTLAPLALEVSLSGGGRDLALAAPVLQAALGPSPSLAATMAVTQDGVRVDPLRVAGAAVDLTGPLALSNGFAEVQADLALVAGPLERLGPALGIEASGSLIAQVRASGAVGAPAVTLDIAGQGGRLGPVDLAGLAGQATLGGSPPSGTARVAVARPEAAEVAFRYAVADGILRLDGIRAGTRGARLDGGLAISLAGPTAEGALAAAVDDLGPLGRLLGAELAGRGSLRLDLSSPRGAQGARLAGAFDALALAGTRIGRVTLDGAGTDLMGRMSAGRLDAEATGIAGPVALDRLRVGVALEGAGARFTANAVAAAKPATDLALAGRVARDATATTITLDRIDGTLVGAPIALSQPARVVLDGGTTSLDALALKVGQQGTVRASGRAAPGALAGTATVRAFPLRTLAPFIPGIALRGQADLDASLDAGPKGADGRLRLVGRNLRIGDLGAGDTGLTRRAATQDMPVFGLDATGRWDGQRATLTARAEGKGPSTLDLDAALPVVWNRRSGAIEVGPATPLDLRVRLDADLSAVAALLPLGEDRLAGRLAADWRVGGTLGAPRPSGSLHLDGGRYEGAALDTIVSDITAELTGDGTVLRLTRLAARDGDDGTLSGSGRILLGAGPPDVDLAVALKGFRVARRDSLSARADADIAVALNGIAGRIAGTVTVREGNATLPSSLPPSIPDIPVTEVNGPVAAAKPAKAAPPVPIALAVAVKIPGRFNVRGRGLESEWAGGLDVGGTVSAPVVTGTVRVVRGSIAFAGKRFPIARGVVTIPPGRTIDPLIDVEASLPGTDVTAKAEISGPVSAPRFTLSSDPPLPQDQILARVLFGRDVSQLTAVQAVSLAQSALELSGKVSTGGPLDAIRRTLGLDRLDVAGAPENAGAERGAANGGANGGTGGSGGQAGGFAGASVTAGRYIAPGVYVGVTQGTAGGPPDASVQVEITPTINLESTVGASGTGGIGLNYRRDY